MAPEIQGLQAGQEGKRCRDGGGGGRESEYVVAGSGGVRPGEGIHDISVKESITHTPGLSCYP